MVNQYTEGSYGLHYLNFTDKRVHLLPVPKGVVVGPSTSEAEWRMLAAKLQPLRLRFDPESVFVVVRLWEKWRVVYRFEGLTTAPF